MIYNFHQEIDLRHSDSIKWEYFAEGATPDQLQHTEAAFGDDRMLPMWIADMDFPASQPVVDALARRAARPIYGYSMSGEAYFAAIMGWMQRRHRWPVAREWIVPTPGIVSGLHTAVRAFAAPGDKVVIQTPVYHPFYSAVSHNDALIVRNPLLHVAGRYAMDFDDLEAGLADPAVKLVILCSPHNLVGRVWSEDELRRLGELCLARGVPVVFDEIHGDLILPGQRFVPFASLGEAFAQNSIVCTAPSKTFNLAGLKTANVIIPTLTCASALPRPSTAAACGASTPLGWRPPKLRTGTATSGWTRRWPIWTTTAGCWRPLWPSACRRSQSRRWRAPIWPGWIAAGWAWTTQRSRACWWSRRASLRSPARASASRARASSGLTSPARAPSWPKPCSASKPP